MRVGSPRLRGRAGGLLLVACLPLTGCTAGAGSAAAPGSSSSAQPPPGPLPPTSSAITGTPFPPVDLAAVTGGTTDVVVDPSFLDRLSTLGLSVAGVGAAASAPTANSRGSDVWSFPVTGGTGVLGAVPPGAVRHDGAGLRLTDGTTTITLTDLVLESADGDMGTVSATVAVDGAVVAGDTAVLAADLAAAEPVRVDDAAGVAVLSGVALRVTAQGAEVVNAAQGSDGLPPFLAVGVATVTLRLR